MSSNHILLVLALAAGVAAAGPYPDAAGQPGSSALHLSSPLFVNWASGHSHYQPGTAVEPQWQTPAKAYGTAGTSAFEIVSLGNGGAITLFFPHPVCDGAGADFAVFENAISDGFLELAFVEISSDGIHFARFPTVSLTPSPVGPYANTMDPTEINGFAGKYKLSYGTPFDLADLTNQPWLDKQHIRFVRLVDIIGDGTTMDSSGRPIYDPTPTTGSGGFDLDAVGVIHQNTGGFRMLASSPVPGGFRLAWESNPGSTYQIQESTNCRDWFPVATVTPAAAAVTEHIIPTNGDTTRFWRVARP